MTTSFEIGDAVRFHPIIGGNHDGRLWKIRDFVTLGLNGERCACLEGKAGCVSLRALSRPKPGIIDPDSPHTTQRLHGREERAA